MSVVDRILRLPELEAAPPVLVDVGAAQGIHPKWRGIAKYSVCLAFEADQRELASVSDESAGFRRLTTYNRIVAERSSDAEPFHLTASPYCSSRLSPLHDRLRRYAFAPLFRVERTVELPAVDLLGALASLGLERVDWLKLDSQGTDLRLFRSLGDLATTCSSSSSSLGSSMRTRARTGWRMCSTTSGAAGFWASDLKVRGSTRVDSDLRQAHAGYAGGALLDACHKPAPGWVEIEYFNDFANDESFGKRELLLGCAFAFLRGHEAFAFELSTRGSERFGSPFDDLKRTALRRLRRRFARLPASWLRATAGGVLRR